MKLRSFTAYRIAGYESVTWSGLQNDMNLLVGRNGAGKSTLLQLISFGLEFLGGRRTEDVLARTVQETDAEIEVTLDLGSEGERRVPVNVKEARGNQGNTQRQYPIRVLQFVENRQPKNTMGLGRNQLRDHPMDRYAHTMSEFKTLLTSKNATDRRIAEEVLQLCRRLPVGDDATWQWIADAIPRRDKKKARPVSCGQFDVLALCLDLVRLRHEVDQEPGNERSSVFVVVDNPETYLHPACQVPALELIRELLPDAQMFVASHSLRLLCWPAAKSVFWLSRDRQDGGRRVAVESVRDLSEGARSAFLELYGDDISSAVFRLLTEFENPAYFKFLCECALPEPAKLRADPKRDRQMHMVRAALGDYRRSWTVLDYGAGHGDLLAALDAWGDTNVETEYVASTRGDRQTLEDRLHRAVAEGKLSPSSRVIADLEEAPQDCDAIVLCNVCHEIKAEELPGLLVRLLRDHLKRSPSSRLVIHEVEVLVAGEAGYIMWSPRDYRQVFASVAAFKVEEQSFAHPTSVPLNTTIFSWADVDHSLHDLEDRLAKGFAEQLPAKKRARLSEYAELLEPRERVGFPEAIRQRRMAFIIAEIAAIALAEERNRVAG